MFVGMAMTVKQAKDVIIFISLEKSKAPVDEIIPTNVLTKIIAITDLASLTTLCLILKQVIIANVSDTVFRMILNPYIKTVWMRNFLVLSVVLQI